MKNEKHNIDTPTQLSVLADNLDIIEHDILLDSYSFAEDPITEDLLTAIYSARMEICNNYLDAVRSTRKPDKHLKRKAGLIHDLYFELCSCPVLVRRMCNARSKTLKRPPPYNDIGTPSPNEIVAREKAQYFLCEALKRDDTK